MVAAQADLYYTRNYPPGVMYLAIFPSAPDGDPAAPVLRQRVREHLQQRIRDGDIADPDVTLPEGDRGIRELVTEVKPKAVVKPKAADAPAASRAAAAAAKPAESRKAATPGKAVQPAAGTGVASKKASTPTPTPKQEKAAAVVNVTKGTKRALDEDDEDAGDSADDSAEEEEEDDEDSADDRGKKATPLEDLSSDDFFSAAPVAKTRRLKEYKVDTGEHRPELSSRRAWLKQRKYVCAGTLAVPGRSGWWLTRRRALTLFLPAVSAAREEREVLSKKGSVIKRQKKEFLHGGDLPESLESLKHGRPSQPAARTHQRFNDDD